MQKNPPRKTNSPISNIRMIMNQQNSNRQPLRRKKLWEIEECFKCALIGSCLTRTELRRLAEEKVFGIEPGAEDYQLHTRFIAIAGRQDLPGKTLHKYLEKKFRQETRKYLLVDTEEEIKTLWAADLADGRPDSAWWAVVTHPLASMELVAQYSRELHMLSHEGVAGYRRRKELIANLRLKVSMLEEVLGSERELHLREKRRLQEELADLSMKLDARAAESRENSRLREEIAARNERCRLLEQTLRESVERRENERLLHQNAELAAQIDELSAAMAGMAEQRRILDLRAKERDREISALENMLLRQESGSNECSTCADRDTANCPGINLCGQTVLYVGGMHNLVSHYRQLVEKSGGRFLHHDGGREASRNLLPKMLATADAVLCPIDCVSHDACNCVKKMCKRFRKRFIPMRSASLSALARGLTHIVQ